MKSNLLYIEASPLKGRSHSTTVAEAFLQAYLASHPDDEIARTDLWRTELPAFDAETIDAKFAVLRKQQFTPEQWDRWEAVRSVSRFFNAADKYLFSVPMWNFGVPYRLKHFIDIVTLPGENWMWSKAQGYEPLLVGKKALLIYSSANDYQDAGNDSDFQKPYLRRWLNFVGIQDIREITIAPTLAEAETVAKKRDSAFEQALSLARSF
jgi:FMN-dependent NADH-azoreductase